MKNAEKLIEDIKYTIDLNKKELIDLLTKNYTREMVISFNINPEEILTMEIFTSKIVINREEMFSANVVSEAQNDTSK